MLALGALLSALGYCGVETIVVNAAGCGAMMKEYAHLLADDPALHLGAELLGGEEHQAEVALEARPGDHRALAPQPPDLLGEVAAQQVSNARIIVDDGLNWVTRPAAWWRAPRPARG